MNRRVAGCVAAAGLLAGAGCGSGIPELTTLEGRVTIDGKPVGAGCVEFVTTDDVNSATAELSPDGTYRVPGAPVGEVRVAVNTQGYERAPAQDATGEKGVARGGKKNRHFAAVPKKYWDTATSGLTTVIGARQSRYDIELASR